MGMNAILSNKELYSEKGWPEKERMHAAKTKIK